MSWEEVKAKVAEYKAQGMEVPTEKMIKTPEQIAGIKAACAINTAVLDEVAKQIKTGMSTEDINTIVYDFTMANDAYPAPLGFEGFPKSVCTSVNDEICHGIPDKNIILRSGDIVNVDVSTIYKDYFADASRMFMLGKVSQQNRNLVNITKECLHRGVKAAKAWGNIGDIGAAISAFAHKHGYSVVEEFGGHGVGVAFHEEPFVPHYGKKGTGMLLVPGMIFTIEPMINMGRPELYVDAENNWTALTEDGKPSAQWEYTILITEQGPEILTY